MGFDWEQWQKKFEAPSPDAKHHELLQAVKANLDDIDTLVADFDRLEEDGVYRYYHQASRSTGSRAPSNGHRRCSSA